MDSERGRVLRVSPWTKERGSWRGCGIAERRRLALIVLEDVVLSQGRLVARPEEKVVVERQRGLLCLNMREGERRCLEFEF